MTTWKRVIDIEPPKDRVIEVTNGFVWNHVDYIHTPRAVMEGSANATRSWKMHGMIVPVRWANVESAKSAWLDRKGVEHPATSEKWEWIAADGGGGLPAFKFWRELDNPLEEFNEEDIEPHLLSATLMVYEEFEGDPRRSELMLQLEREEASHQRQSDYGALDIYSKSHSAKLENSLQRKRDMAAAAYDPPSTPKHRLYPDNAS
jgi:hypothetical protein